MDHGYNDYKPFILSDEILGKISESIRRTIVEGMKQGLFSKNIDIDTFLNLVFGTIDHIIIPWVMFKRNYDLLQIGEETSRLFINAIRA